MLQTLSSRFPRSEFSSEIFCFDKDAMQRRKLQLLLFLVLVLQSLQPSEILFLMSIFFASSPVVSEVFIISALLAQPSPCLQLHHMHAFLRTSILTRNGTANS